jgi:hypothetical protein
MFTLTYSIAGMFTITYSIAGIFTINATQTVMQANLSVLLVHNSNPRQFPSAHRPQNPENKAMRRDNPI